MFFIARKLNQLDFQKLMYVYRESNEENGQLLFPDEEPEQQIANAEQNFYEYLLDYFSEKDAVYCVLTENKQYVSALRVEPYEDGFLIEGLETAPQMRGREFAKQLLTHTLQYIESQHICSVYSHVNKKNLPSLAVHTACGFRKIKDYAVYIDGSVAHNCDTLQFKF